MPRGAREARALLGATVVAVGEAGRRAACTPRPTTCFRALALAQIKKKTAELERNEKRLKSMQSVRPAFMDEYEKLEKELVEEYEIYLERFRNLDFLEHELDACQQAEREKLEASDRALKKLQKKLRDEELRMFIGDQVRGGGGSALGVQWALRRCSRRVLRRQTHVALR